MISTVEGSSDILNGHKPGPFLQAPDKAASLSGVTSPPSLDLNEVSYEVSEYLGPWWKGACLRPKRKKKVLENINLSLVGGHITAVIGSSGSGKTSLLDVITCRGEGRTSGALSFNGHLCSREMMKRHVSYVMQADRCLPHLTVRETLRYTAYLKLPGETTRRELEAKVQEVILQMGLRHVAESRIGSQITRGISGGEKRRVTIAIQLLQDPDVLLLDEPTSGLDSYTAHHLVMNLADLAHRDGKIVLLTVHQPRSDIFILLDELAILSQGHLCYFGKRNELVPYFTDNGYPCPRYTNPLDKYIDVCSVDRRTKGLEKTSLERVMKVVEDFKSSDLYRRVKTVLPQTNTLQKSLYKKTKRPEKGPGLFRIVDTLHRRMTLNLYRDKQSFINRIVLMPSFVIFVIVFLGRLQNNQESIQDRAGLAYQSISVPTHIAILNIVPLFPAIREVYYRECRDGLYSTATFLAAYIIHMFPFSILSSAIFSSVLYWAVGMADDGDKFGMYFATVCLLFFSGEFLVVANMGLFMDPQLVNNVSGLMFTASAVLASGFLRAIPNMPKAMQYVGYASLHKYASEIIVANEFNNLNMTCTPNSTFIPCVFKTGNQYLDVTFPGVLDHMERNFAVLSSFAVACIILSWVCFKVRGIPNLQ